MSTSGFATECDDRDLRGEVDDPLDRPVLGGDRRERGEDAVSDVARDDVEPVASRVRARFARLPVEKLSSTTTRWPVSINAIDGVRSDETGSAGDDDDREGRHVHIVAARVPCRMRAIQIDRTGGPEVMQLADLTVGDPAPGRGPHPPPRDRRQLHRHLPPHRPLPARRCRAVLGVEGAGVVEAVGAASRTSRSAIASPTPRKAPGQLRGGARRRGRVTVVEAARRDRRSRPAPR